MAALVAKNAELLEKLQRVQDVRLSANPPSHFGRYFGSGWLTYCFIFSLQHFFSILPSIAKPSDEEMELAQKVRENLVEMSAKVQPKFVASSEGIRKALGSTDLPQPAPGIVSVVPAPVPIPAAAPPGAVPIPMDVTF